MGKVIVLGAGASRGAGFSPTPPVIDGFFREARQWYCENKGHDLYQEPWFQYACQTCFDAGGTVSCKDHINLEVLFLQVDQRCWKSQKEQIPRKRYSSLLKIVRYAIPSLLYTAHQASPEELKELSDPDKFLKKMADLELWRLELVTWQFIRLHLIFLIAAFLRYRTLNQTCRYHEKLALRLMPGDAVISFNYDTIMDRALKNTGGWDYSDGYGISFNPRGRRGCCEVPQLKTADRVLLLKPHGSLNWFSAVKLDIFTGSPAPALGQPFYYAANNEDIPWKPFVSLGVRNEQVSIEAPAIIPPVEDKESYIDLDARRNKLIPGQARESLYAHPYKPIHDLCERAVRSASQIIFIGYSLPQTDRWASDLFATAPPSCSIQVINPDKRVVQRYQQLFPGTEWICRTLAEYVGC